MQPRNCRRKGKQRTGATIKIAEYAGAGCTTRYHRSRGVWEWTLPCAELVMDEDGGDDDLLPGLLKVRWYLWYCLPTNYFLTSLRIYLWTSYWSFNASDGTFSDLAYLFSIWPVNAGCLPVACLFILLTPACWCHAFPTLLCPGYLLTAYLSLYWDLQMLLDF